jgi:biotin operon repressor
MNNGDTGQPVHELARYLAGDGADYDALRAAWPGLPSDRGAALAWVLTQPDLAGVVFQADPAEDAPQPARKTAWTAAEILTTSFPEPRWTIPGLIPEGLVSLAGRPKLGKSWLALQVACAVGTGGKALGRDVTAGQVLYLALEDSPRRLQKRMRLQHWPATAAVDFYTEWPDLATPAGLDPLRAAVEARGYTLVIIDTLSRAATFDQLDPTISTRVMAGLQRLAIDRGLTVLVIDHHRKRNGFEANVIDDVLGATGKAAVLDAALGLYREHGKREAELVVTGRDLEDTELALEWDGTTCTWQALGLAGEVKAKTRNAEILAVLRRSNPDPLTGTEIASETGYDRGDVNRLLADLETMGFVYRLPKQGRTIPYALTQKGIDYAQ